VGGGGRAKGVVVFMLDMSDKLEFYVDKFCLSVVCMEELMTKTVCVY